MTAEDPVTPGGAAASVHDHEAAIDWAAIGFGVLVVLLGGYFLLRDTLHVALPEIAWDTAWPLIVIVVGLLAVVRGLTGGHRHRRRDRRGS